MAVMNVRINNISAERADRDVKSIEVKANSTIKSVKKEKDKRIGEYLHVNFKYDVVYEPEVGAIRLEGTLWYQHEKLDSVYSEIKDKVELKQEAVKEISTSLIQESVVEAILMSKKLQLPPPIQLPTVTVKGEKYTFSKA